MNQIAVHQHHHPLLHHRYHQPSIATSTTTPSNYYHVTSHQYHLSRFCPLPLQHASPPLLPLPRQPTTLIGKTPLPASILGERRAPLLRDGNHPPMGEMNSALIAKSEEVMGHHPRQPHPPSGHAHPPVYIPEDVVLPPEVELRESCIQEAGLGVFSLDDIPHGRKFGPLHGSGKDRGH